MPKKGYKLTDAQRKNLSDGAKKRRSKLCFLYGFTPEFVREQRNSGFRWCSDCKRWHEGKSRRCKECTHERNRQTYESENPQTRKKRRRAIREKFPERYARMDKRQGIRGYGVGIEWYETKLAEQGGCCALCATKVPNGKRKYFSIDHDHSCCSGRKKACDRCRRGLLCDRCNFSIERAEAIPGWLENVAAYLQRYRLA